ncbi:MAG: HAD-IA family hydrolase [Roseobacter sp.]
MTIDQKPDAVIFDIGNVLIEWHPERFYDAEIGEKQRHALFEAVDLNGMNEGIDLGAPFRETVYAKAEKHPEWRAEIRMWHDRWIEMAQPVIDHSVRLMRALQARGVPVFSLSNFGVESYDFAATHYTFFDEFDRDFVSGRLGLIKPDLAIYTVLEETSGLKGAALLFTDDRPENIAAAQQFGWQTHLFEGPQGWADRLMAAGLLPQEEAQ